MRVWPPVCQCSVTEYVVTAMGNSERSPRLTDSNSAKRTHGEFCRPFIWLSDGLSKGS